MKGPAQLDIDIHTQEFLFNLRLKTIFCHAINLILFSLFVHVLSIK